MLYLLKQPANNNQSQHRSEQYYLQSKSVEPFKPSSQLDPVIAAVTNLQSLDPVELSLQSTEQLTLKNAIEKGQSMFSELIFTKKVCNNGMILEVTQQKMHHVPGSGH